MILPVKSKNVLIDGIIAYRQILWSKNQEGLQIVRFTNTPRKVAKGRWIFRHSGYSFTPIFFR